VRWTQLPPHSRFVLPIDAASVRERTDRDAPHGATLRMPHLSKDTE
jgi:hypothetical protein